jgi:class 3 adenylate cyclase/tetratricopeptide (TPR) repeat protein
MNCPNCRSKVVGADLFCRRCGGRLVPACPNCRAEVLPQDRFCGRCGASLDEQQSGERESARKLVTVVFADLCGYTSMTERLDPEDVRDIMGRIFGEIARVVTRYEGTIEKFIGDAAMFMFGVPKSHEDDPVRAIRAALEIHSAVAALGSRIGDRVGGPLRMHTGINTGLVVTGELKLFGGTQSLTGDTVNVAARLEGLAAPGEILVGPETQHHSDRYFHFEPLAPVTVKGKSEAIRVYRVRSPRSQPMPATARHARRSQFIGRADELNRIQAAFHRSRAGQGTVVLISGEAGTGKSRLVAEFKALLFDEPVQWIEGHAFAYARNNPYSLFIDLLYRTFQIQEGDTVAAVREKVETGLQRLIGDRPGIAPYVAGLLSIREPRADDLNPETWKSRLQTAVHNILAALPQTAPTVVCLEDLHWADPSSLELVRSILADFRYPLMLVCVYRPDSALESTCLNAAAESSVQRERLQDLSPEQTRTMVQSLLNADRIPAALSRFVSEKLEGNPFYLEEVINSLIQTEVLVYNTNRWVLNEEITAEKIPSTIHGVISGRVDRLGKEVKRLLQEASVIGRSFYYEILKKISEIGTDVKAHLGVLERLELINVTRQQPDLEYLFKHALIQEVVYSGLLKKERRMIHERIARVIEEVFADRLSEFYEALAYHYTRSRSLTKSVEYLMRSGQKCLQRYALEEAHRHYREAFDILQTKAVKTTDERRLMIDLLNRWSFVYYYRGRFRELDRLLGDHRQLAESIGDGDRLSMYHAWLGCALWHREMFREAHRYMTSALNLAEAALNRQVVGYAASWLTWICVELGHLDQALEYAERAGEVYTTGGVDPYIYVNSVAGRGYALWHAGNRRQTFEAGRQLLRFGWKNADERSKVMGYCCIGWSRLIADDLVSAAACFQKAVAVSADPWYAVFPKLALCYGLISAGKTTEAEALVDDIIDFSRERGAEFAGTPAVFFRGILLVAKGNLKHGLRLLEDQLQLWKTKGSRLRYVLCGSILASIYAQIAGRRAGLRPARWYSNVVFLLKTLPTASGKAATYFQEFISIAKELKVLSVLGRAYLQQGRMLLQTGDRDRALESFREALACFERCDATHAVTEARAALEEIKAGNG